MESLRKWHRSLDALGAVEELGGAGDEHVQARIAARLQVISELTEGIQALLTGFPADSLNSFYLVENENQALATCLPENFE